MYPAVALSFLLFKVLSFMSDIDAFKRPAPLEAGLMCQVLHGDHAELQDEEQCDDGYHDVF
jgi:hypothetical protein